MNNMGQGFVLAVIGMGVVFFSLAALATLIALLERFFGTGPAKMGARAEPPPHPEVGPEERGRPEPPGGEGIGPVLAAATAYFLESEGPSIFIATPKRPTVSPWAQQSRADALRPEWGR